MAELTGKNLNYQNKFYVLVNPLDKDVFAGTAYRQSIARRFDLVLVENGCFLEPNYVVIESLPDTLDPLTVRDENKLSSNDCHVYKVKIRGQQTQKFCNIIFDFKSKSKA